jgi:hypothetical protein
VLAGHNVKFGTVAAVVKPTAEKAFAFSDMDLVLAVPEVEARRNELPRAVLLQVALLLGPLELVSM